MNKMLTMIGFAKKSGNIALGHQMCIKNMQTGKISLLIIATDLNETSKNELMKVANEKNIKTIIKLDKQTISNAIGKAGYGVIGITSKQFSRSILEKMAEGEQDGKNQIT